MLAKPSRQTGILAWLTQANVPVFLFDHRRRVRFFNQAAEKYFGCTTAEVIGKICHFTSLNSESDPIKKVLQKIAPSPLIYENKIHLSPLTSANQTETHILYLNLELNAPQTMILGIILPQHNNQIMQMWGTSITNENFHVKLDQHLELMLSTFQTIRRERYQQIPLIAEAPSMRLALTQWQLALNVTNPVHIHGQHGTGKRTWIQALHYQSNQGTMPLVTLESELMEYEHFRQELKVLTKIHDHVPLAGGVMLNLIEKLPGDSQRYLLELFHNIRQQPFPFRWFSTSCLSSQQLMEQKLIIPELYYELTPINIHLPPLIERTSDLELLVQYFIEECNATHEHQSSGLTPEVLAEFKKYQWPGNLQELQGVIREAHAQSRSALISKAELPLRFRMGWKTQALGPKQHVAIPFNLEELLMQQEKEWILWALTSTKGNRAAAAQLLGMTRPRLYRRLEALNLLDGSISENDELP